MTDRKELIERLEQARLGNYDAALFKDCIAALSPEWITEAQKARFWIKARSNSYCWWWEGGKNPDGYGTFRVGDNIYAAHRIAYAIANNRDINDLEHIAHTCDYPSCVNPDHLFETDHQGNMTDRQIKGRGKVNKSAKSSQYIGVSWRNDSKKWRATIKVRNYTKSLGCFDSEIDAAKEYDKKLFEYFGDVLSPDSLNFPKTYFDDAGQPLPAPPED